MPYIEVKLAKQASRKQERILTEKLGEAITTVPGNDGQPGKLTNLEIMKPEMYDLRRDPGERYNVITQYPEEAAKLMKIADQKRHELGDDLTRMKGTERREPGLVQGKKRHDL